MDLIFLNIWLLALLEKRVLLVYHLSLFRRKISRGRKGVYPALTCATSLASDGYYKILPVQIQPNFLSL